MYDVIVVGARCAGSPLAMLLARNGLDVLVVDRATFPSDTMSSHAVKKPAVARLANWGVLDRVLDTGCPRLETMHFDPGPFVLTGTAPAVNPDADFTIAPRRTVLDAILVEAAREAGAHIRTGMPVDHLLVEEGRVLGVSCGGGEHRAPLVVGADGLHSLVVRTMKPDTVIDRGTLAAWCYGYWSGLAVTDIELYLRGPRFIAAFPTNDDLTMVAIAWPIVDASTLRADVDAEYRVTVANVDRLAERLGTASLTGRLTSTVDVPNIVRRAYGPGWVLSGDAGYHKDPITAEGISNAFRDADLLAAAITTGLGRGTLDDELGAFEAARNQESMPMFDLTCQLAALGPLPDDLTHLISVLVNNQTATDRFLGVVEGTVTVPEFFAPDHIGSILANA
jgi:2-polyprenyl-6-methoxyphenol hydroxylase-like FAD-dependent oxidoreductase